MTKTQRQIEARTAVHRAGEGVLVDLHFEPVLSVSGVRGNRMTANIGTVPVPSKRYSADTCFLGYSHGTMKMLFGQEKYGTTDLRNLLILKMPPNLATQFIQMFDGVENPSFQDAAKVLGLEAEELPEFGSEPEETVTMNVTLALSAMSGFEGCMDFYHASPFSIAAAGQTKKLALDPVVRIDIRATLMLGLVDGLRNLLRTIPNSAMLEADDV